MHLSEKTIGADNLTKYFHDHNIHQSIATSSTDENLKKKALKHKEMFDRFECVTTANEVKHGKPAPDIFLKAAEKMNAKPSQCIVFEDSPYGIDGAKAAGMIAIAIPGYVRNLDRFSSASEIIKTLDHFNPTKYGMPPRAFNN